MLRRCRQFFHGVVDSVAAGADLVHLLNGPFNRGAAVQSGLRRFMAQPVDRIGSGRHFLGARRNFLHNRRSVIDRAQLPGCPFRHFRDRLGDLVTHIGGLLGARRQFLGRGRQSL